MQIKRLMAGTLAALTAGATLAMGAFAITSLSEYVKPGTDGSLSAPVIVIGAPATGNIGEFAKDVLGAADIAAAVAGYATTSVTSTTATTSVSGGADVATADSKLYFRSSVNKAKSTLTNNDLTSLLATGTAVVSLSGTYTYNQYLNLGNIQSTFGTSSGNFDPPAQYLDVGYAPESAPLYNYTLTFNKPLNVSHSDVRGGTLTLAGVEYTIGSNSVCTGTSGSNLILELFGGANVVTLAEGDPVQDVTFAGITYKVQIFGVSDATRVILKVNDQSYTMDTDDSSRTRRVGDLDIYLKNVFWLQKESQKSSAEFIFGTAALCLQDGSKVKSGSCSGTTTNVDGTLVAITGDSSGISKVTIGVAGEDASNNYIMAGTPFVDPVFGSFKVAFNGLTPALDSSARDTVVVDNSGNSAASVRFTDTRGNTKSLVFAADLPTDTVFSPMLNASTTRKYIVIEGKNVSANDYVFLAPSQQSEFGHIFQLTSMDDIGGTTPAFTITDVMSSDAITVYLEATGKKQFYIDGQAYCGLNASSTVMRFVWGSDVTCAKYGSEVTGTVTAFPLIKLKNGEYMTFVDNRTAFTNATTYELPGNTSTLIDSSQMINLAVPNVTTAGQIKYGWGGSTAGSSLVNITTSSGAAMVNNFPAILILEEKDNNSVQNVVTVDLTENDATNHYLKVDTPVLSDPSGYQSSASLSADPSVTQYVNFYGTYVEYDSENQGIVTVKYPDTQAVATIGIGANPVFSTAGGATTEVAMKITAPVAKLASEVNANAPGADLILIGGPCANSLTAKVLGASEQCDTWAHTKGIIKEVTGAFTDASKALVVAGTTADDTRFLAAKVMKNELTYEV